MKHQKVLLLAALGLLLTPSPANFIRNFPDRNQVQARANQAQSQSFALFNKRVKEYVDQRNRERKKIPSLSKEATPEQIKSYQANFVTVMQAARANAKPGDIFEPTAAEQIRQLIKSEYKGTERTQLKNAVLEAETAGVPLRINYPYPDTKEFTQIPPPLLLKLPTLPKELKYRFVKQNLLLVDTDNDLIVDYMLKALP